MTKNTKPDPTAAPRKILSGHPSCGVIFDDQNEHSRALLTGFLKASREFPLSTEILGLHHKKNDLPPVDGPHTESLSSDFNFLGWIKNDSRTAVFLRKPYEVLLDLSLAQTGRMKKILSKVRADFKVAVNKPSDSFDFRFEMPLSSQENPEAFSQLLACLNKIDLSHP